MSWNNALERKKFERRWSQEEKAYREAGMSEEQILSMREFEEEQYRSNRRYRMHTQEFEVNEFDEDDSDDSDNALFHKYLDAFSVEMPPIIDNSRFGWIQEIENEELTRQILSLSEIDKEILTLLAFEDRSQKEIAEITGVPYRTVKYKIQRFRENLKNIF